MITLYGIKNCDKVKAAQNWLEAQKLDYSFYDYKKEGVKQEWLATIVTIIDWQKMLNTRSTTWRNLAPQERQVSETSQAIHLMHQYPTLIKRPLLWVDQERAMVGFSPQEYKKILKIS